jgi:hypothetical protein
MEEKRIYKTSEELDNILTREFLEVEVNKNNFSPVRISKEVGCDVSTIKGRLTKFDLPKDNLEKLNRMLTKEYLEVNSIDSERGKVVPLTKIAKKMECSPSIVKKQVLKWNLLVATKSEVMKGHIFPKGRDEKISKAKKGKPLIFSLKRNEAISRGKKGKRSNHWKGGITDIHIWIRTLTESKHWRKAVLKRDNYTCQICGSKENLEAHHIKEFNILLKEFLQQYSQFSPIDDKETLVRLAMTYQPFYELTNGKTLCYDCHDIIEDQKVAEYYGKTRNSI